MLMNHLCALIAQPSCIPTKGNCNFTCSQQFLLVVLVHKLKLLNCLLCTIATAAISTEIVVVFEYEGLAIHATY